MMTRIIIEDLDLIWIFFIIDRSINVRKWKEQNEKKEQELHYLNAVASLLLIVS